MSSYNNQSPQVDPNYGIGGAKIAKQSRADGTYYHYIGRRGFFSGYHFFNALFSLDSGTAVVTLEASSYNDDADMNPEDFASTEWTDVTMHHMGVASISASTLIRGDERMDYTGLRLKVVVSGGGATYGIQAEVSK